VCTYQDGTKPPRDGTVRDQAQLPARAVRINSKEEVAGCFISQSISVVTVARNTRCEGPIGSFGFRSLYCRLKHFFVTLRTVLFTQSTGPAPTQRRSLSKLARVLCQPILHFRQRLPESAERQSEATLDCCPTRHFALAQGVCVFEQQSHRFV
jgi:hypothetical protein